MKILEDYNNFKNKTNPNKLTYSLAGDAWNKIWTDKVYKWLPKYPNILIELDHDDKEDIGLIKISVYDSDSEYPGYKSLGTRFFRPIDEERKDFFKWLEELNLIEK